MQEDVHIIYVLLGMITTWFRHASCAGIRADARRRWIKQHVLHFERNTMIASCIEAAFSVQASACLPKAVSLSLQLAGLTNTRAESTLKKSLWWLLCFISTSSFSSLHLFECLLRSPRFAAAALRTREPFSMQNPPALPFDQSHSGLIRASFTLNRSN